jgi:hypothetical protein
MASATIYQRNDGLYLHSDSRTTAGVLIATPPFLKLHLDASAIEKGDAVIGALKASQDCLTHPNEWSGIFTPMLQLAGVTNWAAFMKKSLCVTIDLKRDHITFAPHRNLGPKEGYDPISTKAVQIRAESSPQTVGAALERALSLCE